MPSDRIEFQLGIPVEDALAACRAVAERKGWAVEAAGPHRLAMKQGMKLNNYAVKMDAILAPTGGGDTTVRVDGRIAGWGPIQKKALREALNSFQSEALASAPSRPEAGRAGQGAASQVEALERLAELRDRGVLTDDEFAAQKQRILSE
jgi:hypothetical protein